MTLIGTTIPAYRDIIPGVYRDTSSPNPRRIITVNKVERRDPFTTTITWNWAPDSGEKVRDEPVEITKPNLAMWEWELIDFLPIEITEDEMP